MLCKLLLQILNVVIIVESRWSKLRLRHFAELILVCICKLEASAAGSDVVLIVRLPKEVKALTWYV